MPIVTTIFARQKTCERISQGARSSAANAGRLAGGIPQ